MNSDLVLSFAMLFASVIALICAIYLYLYYRYNKKFKEEELIE